MIKQFLKNLKNYIDYIMKLDFKELFVNFMTIIMMVILSCLVYLPVGVVRDALYQFILIFINTGTVFFTVYNIIFNLLCGLIAMYIFIYMFNKRFSDIDKLKKELKEKYNEKNNDSKEKKEKDSYKESGSDDFELPKVKEK